MTQSHVLRGSAALAAQTTSAAFDWSIADSRALEELDAGEWNRLSRESLADNPSYARPYMLAGLDTIDRGSDIRALVMRSPGAGLVALFPFRRLGVGPLCVARGASNPYQFSGTPLVHHKHAARAIAQFADLVAAGRLGPLFMLPDIDTGSPFGVTLMQEARRAGLVVQATRRYERPLLTRMEGGFERHVEAVMSPKRVKDLYRNLRRLKELGDVSFERLDCSEDIDDRLEDFLRIEQSGWKGAKGTAFLSDPRHAAFARAAFGGRAGLTAIDSLLLDGVPIAVSLNTADGPVAFTPKCAYDEAYRRFSPGLLLEYFVIKAFYEDRRWRAMDSATGIEGHIIGGFWNENLAMANLALAPDSVQGRVALATCRLLARSHARAKRLRDWLKKRS